MTDPTPPSMIVGDLAISKLAAQAATSVPGVVRLVPTLAKIVKNSITKAARTLTNQPDPDQPVDPGAVAIDRDTEGVTSLTVRIIVDCGLPALETVNAVQLAVLDVVRGLEASQFDVTVLVIDAELV